MDKSLDQDKMEMLQRFLNSSESEGREELEYREDDDLNKYSTLLRPRSDILCQKFIDQSKKKMISAEKESVNLTDMIHVKLETKDEMVSPDKLEEIGNQEDKDKEKKDLACTKILELALTSQQKCVQNSEDAEVGVRRLYEKEFSEEDIFMRHTGKRRKSCCTNRDTLVKLGLWDVVFDESKYPLKKIFKFFLI